jgi:hypothetical protein
MPDKTWKAVERKVARKLGGQRIPCSGNGEIPGDVQHPRWHVEVKTRKNLVLKTWYDKAKEDSKKNPEGEKPVLLVVKMKGSHRTFVVMDIDDFVKLEGAICQ